MTIKRITVHVDHSFDLDIPDGISLWERQDFIYDAFIDDESNWDEVDFDVNDIKEQN